MIQNFIIPLLNKDLDFSSQNFSPNGEDVKDKYQLHGPMSPTSPWDIGSGPSSPMSFLSGSSPWDIGSGSSPSSFSPAFNNAGDLNNQIMNLMSSLLVAIMVMLQQTGLLNKFDEDGGNNGPTTPPCGPTTPPSGPTTPGSPTAPTGPSSMPEPTGTVVVNEPIVVKAGEVFDGGGKLYKAGSNLGDGGQGEGQKPIFIIEPGGKVQNLQYEGADGIHTYGDATIENVWVRDVGEDALTMKERGNVRWNGGGAFNASDKIFQINAGGSLTVENFTADNFGKAFRTNGGKNIDVDITVINSNFTNGKEAIVRTDSTTATITLLGVTFSDVPNDVLAPSGTVVNGAVKRGEKEHKG